MSFKKLPFRVVENILGEYFLFYIVSPDIISTPEDWTLQTEFSPKPNFLFEFFGYFTMDKKRKIFLFFKNITFDYSESTNFRVRGLLQYNKDLLMDVIPMNLRCVQQVFGDIIKCMFDVFKKKRVRMIKNKYMTIDLLKKTAFVKKYVNDFNPLSFRHPCSLVQLDFFNSFFNNIVICRGCNFDSEFLEFFENNGINLFEKYPQNFSHVDRRDDTIYFSKKKRLNGIILKDITLTTKTFYKKFTQ